MSRYVALFALFVLGAGLFGTWAFVSQRRDEAKYLKLEAAEVDRRVDIAGEIAAGERDATGHPWYDHDTMGPDVAEPARRDAIRKDLEGDRSWVSPLRSRPGS
jgi:hypothetical protein